MDHIPVNTTLLERLALVRPDQWSRIERCARRVARGLPLVESVWIDAMLRLGHITPYQAKRLQEGDAESLQVGSYVILNRRESLGWADCFDAYRIDDRRTVNLAVIQGIPPEAWEPLSERLIQRGSASGADYCRRFLPETAEGCRDQKVPDAFFLDLFLPVDEVGIDDRRGVWVASSPCPGESVARWMVQHGRFSPTVVLEIASQMAVGLSQLQSQQKTHGDLRAATLFLDATQGTIPFLLRRDRSCVRKSQLKLLLPEVRTVVRPRESFAETAGPIDMYDGLSPERAADGTVPDEKSDLFAAGSLWWQMLVGRSPMPGGDGRAKLRAAARRKIDDVRKHAADVPEPLARVIDACTARARDDRSDSFREVVAMLGSSGSRGAWALQRLMRGSRSTSLPIVSTTSVSWQARYLGRAIVVMGILVAVVALGLAANRFFNPPSRQVVVVSKPSSSVDIQPAIPSQYRQGNFLDKEPSSKESLGKEPPTVQAKEITPHRNTIVLDSHKLTAAEVLARRLKPGIKVASHKGQRAKVVVNGSPFLIKVPGVQFENVDFIVSNQEEFTASETHQAMLELRGSDVTFRGCTFHGSHDKESTPRTVLHWIFPDLSSVSNQMALQTELHNGRILFEDCIFGRGTGTALHAEVHAAVAVELRNVLHLGGGPMFFLETPPKSDEPWRILAEHVTLRESGPFWACRYVSTVSGAVRIEANDSAFALKGTQPLLLFVGENDPEPIFRKIEWTGRGTLVKKETPTAAWQDNAGNRDPLSDQQASIDGLIHSQIKFIGPADSAPPSSVLQSWDAPITSETPPGVDVGRLP